MSPSSGSALRVGHGIDVHRLAPGRPLRLGGVDVPFEAGLVGHSDGDAATHALADAVLGAAGLGDLGRHFPPGDERWRGADSLDLLARVRRHVAEAGLLVVSAQVVIVAERPQLAGHLEAMAGALAGALAVPAGTVTVSATTTDGIGLCGRGEGIAASAVALLDGGPSIS